MKLFVIDFDIIITIIMIIVIIITIILFGGGGCFMLIIMTTIKIRTRIRKIIRMLIATAIMIASVMT